MRSMASSLLRTVTALGDYPDALTIAAMNGESHAHTRGSMGMIQGRRFAISIENLHVS